MKYHFIYLATPCGITIAHLDIQQDANVYFIVILVMQLQKAKAVRLSSF